MSDAVKSEPEQIALYVKCAGTTRRAKTIKKLINKTMKNVYKSLAKFHEIMGNIAKDKDNPYFKSKYAPLESILPAIKGPLKEAGLVFFQAPTWLGEGQPALGTTLIDIESGEKIETIVPLILAKQDPQGVGSAITYMRRYSLVAMLGLNCDEDDDGNAASAKVTPKAAVATPKVTPPEGSAYESALGYIKEADTIEYLNNVNEKIIKSKILTSDEKAKLTGLCVDKLQTLDPIA